MDESETLLTYSTWNVMRFYNIPFLDDNENDGKIDFDELNEFASRFNTRIDVH